MLTRPTLSALHVALDPPLARLLRTTEAAASDTGCDLWAVGGVVRDVALGAQVHDLDLAVRGPLDALLASIEARANVEALTTKHEPRFGTASLVLDGRRLDLAHLRTEGYVEPGALPLVEATQSLEADLRRRDFTVNAVALGLVGPDRGRVVDPFDGLRDLEARTLRVLHDRSFQDDATRLWRGARTAALFDLRPDPVTQRLIEDGTRWLASISGERLWAEFARTAGRGRVAKAVGLLDDWGVLRGTHEAWTLPEASRDALKRRAAMPAARLAAVMLAPLPRRAAVLDRLSAPREARLAVEEAAHLLEEGLRVVDGVDPRRLVALEGARKDARVAARWLDPAAQPPLQRELRRWERTRAPLTAEELVALGVPRSPALGSALHGLRRARYLGTLGSGADARRNARDAVRSRLDRLRRGEGWD